MSHTLSAPAVRRPLRSSPAEAPLRLTARGRVLILVATLAMALAVIGLGQLGGSADAADQSGSGPVAHSWVVQPGETLWSIAQSVTPGVDPRDTVARIVDLNDLPDSSVVAGTRIFVPAS